MNELNIKCIYIEDYSFMEQIQLFANAELIVAPSGAFFTNLIFCRKNRGNVPIASTYVSFSQLLS